MRLVIGYLIETFLFFAVFNYYHSVLHQISQHKFVTDAMSHCKQRKKKPYILYSLLYNKKEYNLMMADIVAETSSC